ncbi:putative alcohol dehydrogenase [Linderina pennispora]|uniref:Putative alcohol dehydrogenase n=1 Tax=Linderina pennispora TaxID=61395 RepID=A0A1Y1VZT0_9FUNG|nr:putative alcohol dehydrogenase [Linderina pennispora]ORX66778.1 putative alcohol dehydrogenase [Linderina pennispora]
MHPYRGAEKGLRPGTVCGHEFAGVVEQVGSGVALDVGQRVAASFTTACGDCWYCTHHLSSRCDAVKLPRAIGIHGGQAQFVRVPNANGTLMALPDDVSFEEGVLIGDIFSTGYFCAKNALSTLSEAGIPVAELSIAVVGCGPVGLCAVMCAKQLGFGTIYAIDRVESRLQMSERLGAIPVSLDKSPAKIIGDATVAGSRHGVDGVLEVVGNYGALQLAFELVRPGGVVSSVGVHAHDKGFPVSPEQCYDKNITYRCGRCPARSLMDELVPLIRGCNATQIISHRVPLTRAVEMYKMFDSQADGALKVIFDPWA